LTLPPPFSFKKWCFITSLSTACTIKLDATHSWEKNKNKWEVGG